MHPLSSAIFTLSQSSKSENKPFWYLTAENCGGVDAEMPSVSVCEPLCAIFLREPSVYPFLPVKTNVSHLCEKLKNAMKSDLEQRCGGNFLAIVAGTILGEKPNFLSRIFEWGKPFDKSTR